MAKLNETPLTDEQSKFAAKWYPYAIRCARRCRWAVEILGLDEAVSVALWGLVYAARSYDPSKALDGRVMGYVKRVIKSHLSTACKRKGLIARKSNGSGIYSDPVPVQSITNLEGQDWHPVAEDDNEELERMADVRCRARRLLNLAGPQHRPILSNIMHGVTLKEMAEAYGVSRQAIEQRVSRAIRTVIVLSREGAKP